jgi:hypothetical protein
MLAIRISWPTPSERKDRKSVIPTEQKQCCRARAGTARSHIIMVKKEQAEAPGYLGGQSSGMACVRIISARFSPPPKKKKNFLKKYL